MRWQRLAMRAISEYVSLIRQPFSPRCGLRILMYHTIGSSSVGDKLGLNTITAERFGKHVDILVEMVTTTLLPLNIPQDELQIAITFDDGYADNLYVAAPLLAEHNLTFTVFVTSDFVRNRRAGFLSPTELKELARVPGATIGAHSRTHRHLTECSEEDLRSELEDSKHYLEDLIAKPVTSLAYPYGATDIRVRDAALRAGYQIGTCSRFDINRPKQDELLLNRCVILRDDTPRVLHQKLRGDWDWYRWRSFLTI